MEGIDYSEAFAPVAKFASLPLHGITPGAKPPVAIPWNLSPRVSRPHQTHRHGGTTPLFTTESRGLEARARTHRRAGGRSTNFGRSLYTRFSDGYPPLSARIDPYDWGRASHPSYSSNIHYLYSNPKVLQSTDKSSKICHPRTLSPFSTVQSLHYNHTPSVLRLVSLSYYLLITLPVITQLTVLSQRITRTAPSPNDITRHQSAPSHFALVAVLDFSFPLLFQ